MCELDAVTEYELLTHSERFDSSSTRRLVCCGMSKNSRMRPARMQNRPGYVIGTLHGGGGIAFLRKRVNSNYM